MGRVSGRQGGRGAGPGWQLGWVGHPHYEPGPNPNSLQLPLLPRCAAATAAAPTSDSARTIFQSSRASPTLGTAVCGVGSRGREGAAGQMSRLARRGAWRTAGGQLCCLPPRPASAAGLKAAPAARGRRPAQTQAKPARRHTLVDCGRPSKLTYVAYLQEGVGGWVGGWAALDHRQGTPCNSSAPMQGCSAAMAMRRLGPAGLQDVNAAPSNAGARGPRQRHPLFCVGGGRQHNVGACRAAVAVVALQAGKRRESAVGMQQGRDGSTMATACTTGTLSTQQASRCRVVAASAAGLLPANSTSTSQKKPPAN